MTNRGITDLKNVIASLPETERALFERLYAVDASVGRLRVPPTLRDRVEKRFGSVEAVSEQEIVRVTNLITQEESLFNPLRRLRQTDFGDNGVMEAHLASVAKSDIFANPLGNTPEDIFGRVTGASCVTASNLSKYDSLHGVIIFNDFHPLRFTQGEVLDYIATAQEWAHRARQNDPEARYFFMIWNCLWRAGASIFHGHAQVMLARKRHYAKVERLRQTALTYRDRYRSDYFEDLFRAHQMVGCGLEVGGIRMLAHLSPFKDNEVVLMADSLTDAFKERLYDVLVCYRDKLGVVSFNLALATPPLGGAREGWEGFPVIAWMVDRGDIGSRATDVGGMEIYGSSVNSSDPFELARHLEICLL